MDSDQYEEGIYTSGKSAVLTSMLKSVETSTKYALSAIQDKTFKSGVVVLDMKTNGVDYSQKTLNSALQLLTR